MSKERKLKSKINISKIKKIKNLMKIFWLFQIFNPKYAYKLELLNK